MKCVKNIKTGEVRRVTDAEADQLTWSHPETWDYASKSEWKQAKSQGGRS